MKKDARVKTVVSNHMKASLRKTGLILQHVVEVLQTINEGNKSASEHRTNDNKWREREERTRGLSHPTLTAKQGEMRYGIFPPLTSSCPQLNKTLSNPQLALYIPSSVEYSGSFKSGLFSNVSG